MKHRNIFYTLLLLLTISACSKDDIMVFDREEAGIYFQSGGQVRMYMNIDAYYDSLSFSFSVVPPALTDTLLTARIRTMGKVRNYDRPIKVVVDEAQTTAVEGTHFTIDHSKAVIPAGQSEVAFPIRFLRATDLTEKAVKVVLKLEDNEHFKIYFEEQKNTNIYNDPGEQIRANYFVFEVSEIYTEPWVWSSPYSFNGVFGEWTITKYKYVNDFFGITVEDWENANRDDSKVKASYAQPWALQLRNHLQELADAGTPVLDEDGNYMQLGPGFEVDYSKIITN